MIQCKKFTRIKYTDSVIGDAPDIKNDNIADRINEWAIDHPNIRITNVTVSLSDEILVFFEEKDGMGDLRKELVEIQELLFEMFNQTCQVKYVHETKSFIYNDHGISAYAWVQKYLIKIGRITKEQCE